MPPKTVAGRRPPKIPKPLTGTETKDDFLVLMSSRSTRMSSAYAHLKTAGKVTKPTQEEARRRMSDLLRGYHALRSTQDGRETTTEPESLPTPPASMQTRSHTRKASNSALFDGGSQQENSNSTPVKKKPKLILKVSTPPRSTSSASNGQQSNEDVKRNLKRLSPTVASEDEEKQPAPKKAKPTPQRTSPRGKRKVASGRIDEDVPAAEIQQHTGRFGPIKSNLPRATKIKKSATPATLVDDSSDTATSEVELNDTASGVEESVDAEQKHTPADDQEVANEDASQADDAIEQEAESSNTRKNTKGRGAGRGRGRGKGDNNKKGPPSGYKGNPTNMGSSKEKPVGAPLAQPWPCATRDCTTGQTWYDRDVTGGVGRKVISEIFGRNKKATRFIHTEVWHNRCRKCYQRGVYRVRKLAEKRSSRIPTCNYYLDHLRMQLIRLKLWRPDAKWKVQVTTQGQKSLGKYTEELTKNGLDVAAARRTLEPVLAFDKHDISPHKSFPLDQSMHFKNHLTGDNKTYADLDNIVSWIQGLVDSNTTPCLPSMEFLIHAPVEGEMINDPTDNYNQWAEQMDTQAGQQFTGGDTTDADDSEEDGDNEDEGVDDKAEHDTEEDEEDDNEAAGVREPSSILEQVDDESGDEEEQEPKTPQAPRPKLKFTHVSGKQDVRPNSSTYGHKEGSGFARDRLIKRGRNAVDDDDIDAADPTPSKRRRTHSY